MVSARFRRILAGAMVVACLSTGMACAGTLSVAPTTLQLPAQGGTAVLYAMNRSDHPIVVQVEGYAWLQEDNRDRLVATDALQTSPPMARIAPGEKQTIRLRVGPAAASRERTFRLLVSELPDPNRRAADSVRVLLQFNVPMFVGSPKDDRPALTWRAQRQEDGIRLSVRNSGTGYAKLVDLVAIAPGRRRTPVTSRTLKYVLAGAERSWLLPPATAAVGQKLVIEGTELHGGTALHTTVTVGN